MSKYNFYYDESEHSRKINHKTITADNYSDSFVAVIVGWLLENQTDLYAKYDAFETKYQYRQSNGELKSTTVKQSQMNCGFASLNKENISLLEDFLALFDDKIFIYYLVISKIEYIIHQLFEDYENSLFIDMDAMKYSITKALVLYQPNDIMAGLYENTGELITLLRGFFSAQIEENKANKQLKQKEIEQFEQILLILDDVSIVRTIDWNYDIAFAGFKKYLTEKTIDDYTLTIDREGENGNTANAAKRVGLYEVSEKDSLASCGIRMADMLAGIVSKLLKALHNALCYASPEERVNKKILEKSWFQINERQLALYKKMHYVVIELNNAWYKTYSGTYSDDLIVLISLLGFMNHFESVDEIERDIEMQGEYFNAYCCESLTDYYASIRSKLPIDHISQISGEYFLNQRGAKVFFDANRQSLLEIQNGQRICDVLSVGFSGEMIPLITVSEENKAKCYRLPIELSEWAATIFGFANKGEVLFPSKVVFSKTHDNYYADIL